MAVIRSHSLSIGIVGLPNAGKSTLFNSLTKNSVPAENFPFCTIDQNVGVVEVPDPRLDKLADYYKAEKTVHSAITVVDIAGLVKGASEGEGLGNQFLAHIREVDAIMYVLRGFTSQTVTHVYERIDPWEDFQIVQTELILKDIESVNKKFAEITKRTRTPTDRVLLDTRDLLEKVLKKLGEGVPVLEMGLSDAESELIYDLWLLSAKPRIFIINVREGTDDTHQNQVISEFKEKMNSEDILLPVDVKLLGEISDMSGDELEEFLSMLEQKPTGVKEIIDSAYARLHLMTFYTGSQKECNAWSIVQGATTKEAAGAIHTDLAEGFITADIVNVEKMIDVGGYIKAKEQGLVKNHGKEHLMEDGDYMIVYSH